VRPVRKASVETGGSIAEKTLSMLSQALTVRQRHEHVVQVLWHMSLRAAHLAGAGGSSSSSSNEGCSGFTAATARPGLRLVAVTFASLRFFAFGSCPPPTCADVLAWSGPDDVPPSCRRAPQHVTTQLQTWSGCPRRVESGHVPVSDSADAQQQGPGHVCARVSPPRLRVPVWPPAPAGDSPRRPAPAASCSPEISGG